VSAVAERPTVVIAPDLDAIHAALRPYPHFGMYRKELRGNGFTKRPYTPATGVAASSTDPATWGTYEEACAAYRRGGWDGVGFFFHKGDEHADPFCVLDLDKVRDPETGRLDPRAEEIVRDLDSLTEPSVSATGLHIVAKGTLPGKGHNKALPNGLRLELYDRVRFMTLTGERIAGPPPRIESRQSVIDHYYNLLGGGSWEDASSYIAPVGRPNGLTDEQVLEAAFRSEKGQKIRDLFGGSTSYHKDDDSAADLSLCNYLAFTGGDPEQVDRLFRTSDLYRPKWDERRGAQTYGELTISKAFKDRTDYYSPLHTWPVLVAVNGHAGNGTVAGECSEAVAQAVAQRDARIAQLEEIVATQREAIARRDATIAKRDAAIALLQERERDVRAIIANPTFQGNTVRAELGLLWSTDSSLQEGNPQPTRIYPETFAKMTGMSESAASDQIKRLADGTRWKREIRSVRRDAVDTSTGEILINPATGEPQQWTVRQTWITRVAPTAAEAFHAATSAVPIETTKPWGGSRIPRCKEHPGAPVDVRRIVTCTACDALVSDTTEQDPPTRNRQLDRAGGRNRHLDRVKYEQPRQEEVEECKGHLAVCTPALEPTPIRTAYPAPPSQRYKRCHSCHISLLPQEYTEGYCASCAIGRELASAPPIDDDPVRWAGLSVAGGAS
jgi:putative DNA primase/helicase